MPKIRKEGEKIVNVIMPGDLKDNIKIKAIKEQLSMNDYIVKILSAAVKEDTHFEKDEGYMSTGELQKLQDV